MIDQKTSVAVNEAQEVINRAMQRNLQLSPAFVQKHQPIALKTRDEGDSYVLEINVYLGPTLQMFAQFPKDHLTTTDEVLYAVVLTLVAIGPDAIVNSTNELAPMVINTTITGYYLETVLQAHLDHLGDIEHNKPLTDLSVICYLDDLNEQDVLNDEETYQETIWNDANYCTALLVSLQKGGVEYTITSERSNVNVDLIVKMAKTHLAALASQPIVARFYCELAQTIGKKEVEVTHNSAELADERALLSILGQMAPNQIETFLTQGNI